MKWKIDQSKDEYDIFRIFYYRSLWVFFPGIIASELWLFVYRNNWVQFQKFYHFENLGGGLLELDQW